MQALAIKQDPIFEVTGVTAVEILERCARIRGLPAAGVDPSAGLVAGVSLLPAKAAQRTKPWRLSEFSQGSNRDFIKLAYVALLNRPATSKEIEKRLRQLSSGKTRLGIMARLMLLPASCRQDLRLRGVILLALRKYALYRNREVIDTPSSTKSRPIRRPTTVVKKAGLIREISEFSITLPKIGRMRRKIKQLEEEVCRLKARIEQ